MHRGLGASFWYELVVVFTYKTGRFVNPFCFGVCKLFDLVLKLKTMQEDYDAGFESEDSQCEVNKQYRQN
jgi:hypothetical protein